jgi:hypothetical protein
MISHRLVLMTNHDFSLDSERSPRLKRNKAEARLEEKCTKNPKAAITKLDLNQLLTLVKSRLTRQRICTE